MQVSGTLHAQTNLFTTLQKDVENSSETLVLYTNLHCVISEKTEIFISNAVSNSNFI
jgi:hypothetical protein